MRRIELPDTGEGITEGTFLEWLVEEGDTVEEDQTVAEVETDKAVVDVPAPASGTVDQLKAEAGDTVEVGEVIMTIEEGGEEEGRVKREETAETREKEQEELDAKETEESKLEEKGGESLESGDVEQDNQEAGTAGEVLALPKVRKLAAEKGVDLESINTGERITEEEVLEVAGEEGSGSGEEQAPQGPGSEVNASPAVRKLARQKGVDITGIEGSGRGGEVTRDDVLEAGGGTGKQGSEAGGGEEEERVPMSGLKKTEARRVSKSRFTAPHVTHIEKADVTDLVELREEKNKDVSEHLTYLPFIMKAACLALEEYPSLNAELDEENDEIILKRHYDFNIAVDTDRGLVVPVVENVDDKSIVELAAEIDQKAGKARSGDLEPGEMENGTFSITNLGVIGGEAFTPIITYPQVAILGIGRISTTPEIIDGVMKPRETVKLSLSYDHRVVDGATAARFMNELVENLEDPAQLLIEL